MSIAETSPRSELPGKAVPYVLPASSGRAHLLISDVGPRSWRRGVERADVGHVERRSAGATADPAPLPRAEYEYFYCFDGLVQLWARRERLLVPGDFGSSRRARLTPTSSCATGRRWSARSRRAAGIASLTSPASVPGWRLRASPYPPPPFESSAGPSRSSRWSTRPTSVRAGDAQRPRRHAARAPRPYFLKRSEGEKHLFGGMSRPPCAARRRPTGRWPSRR